VLGIVRAFGPFCRDFLVPWNDIVVTRKTILFLPVARLQFGNPAIGALGIPDHLANSLARAAIGRWPEAGPIAEETRRGLYRGLLSEWGLLTCLAALFFTLVPMAVAPPSDRPPILWAILFPAIAFGVNAIIQFFRAEN
jgi:hypothetical protein